MASFCLSALILNLLLCVAAASDGLFESFDPGWEARWHYSTAKKYDGRFQTVPRPSSRGRDTGIMVPEPNRHYGLAARLLAPLAPGERGLLVQYEVQITDTHACGGAYLKLLSHEEGRPPGRLGRKTPYTVMFGPDRCGAASRVHVILKLSNPATGGVTEHHLTEPPLPPNDKLPHVYTLELDPAADSVRVLIDGEQKAGGRLTDAAAFTPPLRPPREVPDPSDAKPADWDEREQVDDPTAVKPKDWDNRRMVPDEAARPPDGWDEGLPSHVLDESVARPPDWDDARDGAWMPPMVENPQCRGLPGCGPWQRPYKRNPDYRGVWLPPQVPNPAYKGEWKPRLVPNPEFFEDAPGASPLSRAAAVSGAAFEIWTTDRGYLFDGVLVGPAGGPAARDAAGYRERVWRRRYWEEYLTAEAAHRRAQIANVTAPARWLMLAFEAPPLSRLRGRAVPALELLYAHPWLAWPALLLPAGGGAMLALLLGGAGRRTAPERPRRAAAGAGESGGDGEGSGSDRDSGGQARGQAPAQRGRKQQRARGDAAGAGPQGEPAAGAGPESDGGGSDGGGSDGAAGGGGQQGAGGQQLRRRMRKA